MTNIVENIVKEWKAEDDEKLISESYLSAWQNPENKKAYEDLKSNIQEKYGGVDPAKFIGHLEDRELLWQNIKDASSETDMDPNLIYIVGMGEGLGNPYRMHYTSSEIDYDPNDLVHTFEDVGLDTFFEVQDTLLERGYLSERIETSTPGGSRVSESGRRVKAGDVSIEDAWKMTGALLKYTEDGIQNLFKNRNLDYDNLSNQEKTFWIYSAYNAGLGNAADLLDSAGSMEEVFKQYEVENKLIDNLDKEISNIREKSWKTDLKWEDKVGKHYKENPGFWAEQDVYRESLKSLQSQKRNKLKFTNWMYNVFRLTGGYELMEETDPFSYGIYE